MEEGSKSPGEAVGEEAALLDYHTVKVDGTLVAVSLSYFVAL